MASELRFQDSVNLGRLKRFRDRSMRNPTWLRDPEQLLRYLSGGVVPTASEHWPEDSLFADQIREVAGRVHEFRRYLRRHNEARRHGADPMGDQKWADVLASVDALITDAERLKGSRLRGSI